MQEIGRITTRIKLGGGLNLLAIAGAGYLVIKSMVKIVECNNEIKRGEAFDELKEAAVKIKEVSDSIMVKKSDENAEEKEEVAE